VAALAGRRHRVARVRLLGRRAGGRPPADPPLLLGTRGGLARLAAWARTHGRPPTTAEAGADPELPGLATCQHLYGSWNAALRAAHLTPEHEAHWSDEHVRAVLSEWARWHTRHGRGEPSAASYRRWAASQSRPVPSASSIRRRYGGSWNAARVAAGLAASRGGRPPASRSS
jgi:hypothetical protein